MTLLWEAKTKGYFFIESMWYGLEMWVRLNSWVVIRFKEWFLSTCIMTSIYWHKHCQISNGSRVLLFFGCDEASLTPKMEKQINRCYTRLFKSCLTSTWSQNMANKVLLGPAQALNKNQARMLVTGHCYKSNDDQDPEWFCGPLSRGGGTCRLG